MALIVLHIGQYYTHLSGESKLVDDPDNKHLRKYERTFG